MKCTKCGSYNIVAALIFEDIQASNSLYINKEFGKIHLNLQVLWCSECGTPYDSSILSINKPQ